MSAIHPTAVIAPSVDLGVAVTVGPYAVVDGPSRIGDRVWIGPHTSIGAPAQMRDHPHRTFATTQGDTLVKIGDDTIIREFVTIHQGTDVATSIGRGCYVMAYAHVPHDARIGSNCTLSNAVQIGGHSFIGDGVNVGLGAVLHQRTAIGPGAMVGMQAAVTHPVPPFAKVLGVPARIVGANAIAMRNAGLAEAVIDMWDRHLRSGGESPIPLDLDGVLQTFGQILSRPEIRDT